MQSKRGGSETCAKVIKEGLSKFLKCVTQELIEILLPLEGDLCLKWFANFQYSVASLTFSKLFTIFVK